MRSHRRFSPLSARRGAAGPRWGDSNLYLRRHGEQLTLAVEHRAAASINNVHLVLDTADAAVALCTDHSSREAVVAATVADPSLEQRLVDHLAAATTPITATALRKLCQVRNAAIHRALIALVDAGRVRKHRTGYALAR